MSRAMRSLGIVALIALAGCAQASQIVGQLADNPGARAAMTRGATRAVTAQLPVDEEEERAYGGAVAVEIVARYGGLVQDQALQRYVGSVGMGLAATSARPTLRWHFGVLASDVPNAWSAPGGYVFITRGLLVMLRDEAELAGVLGHEIAHITRRHAVKIFQNLKSAAAMSEAAQRAWRTPGSFQKLIDGYVQDYLANGMPRDLELEADADAVGLVGAIGYNPMALAEVLERLRTTTAPQPGAASHPDLSERILKLRALPARGGDRVAAARFVAALRAAGLTNIPPEPDAAPTPRARPAPNADAD